MDKQNLVCKLYCILNSETQIPWGNHLIHFYFQHDSPLTTAAVAFGHFVSAGMTPGAEGADWEGSCRIPQIEEAGLREGRWNQIVCLPYDWL